MRYWTRLRLRSFLFFLNLSILTNWPNWCTSNLSVSLFVIQKASAARCTTGTDRWRLRLPRAAAGGSQSLYTVSSGNAYTFRIPEQLKQLPFKCEDLKICFKWCTKVWCELTRSIFSFAQIEYDFTEAPFSAGFMIASFIFTRYSGKTKKYAAYYMHRLKTFSARPIEPRLILQSC